MVKWTKKLLMYLKIIVFRVKRLESSGNVLFNINIFFTVTFVVVLT